MNSNTTQTEESLTKAMTLDRRQFCSALGLMGIALATPGLAAGHPLGFKTETALEGPKGRRKPFSKTVGIL